MSALHRSWATFVNATKDTAASLTDLLAEVGERMPILSSLTFTTQGVTVTVTPKPPAPPAPPSPPQQPPICPTCGRPR